MYKPSTYFDYDLFIFTPEIKIHIASGGAEIPWALINLTNNNLKIFDYHANLGNEYKTETNTNLNRMIYEPQLSINNDFNPENYVSSFMKFASWGFYSFDKTNISNSQDSQYHLVAYPTNYSYEKVENFIESKENQKILKRNYFLNPLINEIDNKNFRPISLVY